MRFIRVRRVSQIVAELGLLVLLAQAVGCESGDASTKHLGQPSTQAEQDAERQARLKAFGKTTIPGKTTPKQ
jgi:hypothetical protein